MTEHRVHHCHGHAILRRVLDFGQRQDGEISDVGEQIKDDHNPAATTSARTRFFPGSRTSLPTNVTFVQAVCANSGPTIDLPKSSAKANPPTNVKPGCAICGLQPLAHEFHHAALRAALVACQPNDKPITTTAVSAAVFANVNVF